MRLIVQNSLEASCEVNNEIVGKISHGFVVLVGFTHSDNEETVEKMAKKMLSIRVFEDENHKTNLSLEDVDGEILSISQFTLYGSLKDGRRPSFVNAMAPQRASELYDYFNKCLENEGYKVEKGIFGADMRISLINKGPFTTILDSEELGL